ncbi:MAG: hypothetical protein ACLPJH_08435 [Myxococcaceae bacterium]
MPHRDLDRRNLSGLRPACTGGVQQPPSNLGAPAATVALGAGRRPVAVEKDAGFKPKVARELLGRR